MHSKRLVTNSSPFLKFLFAQMEATGTTDRELSNKTGICEATIRGWRTRTTPRLMDMEAALNAIGFELKIGALNNKASSVNNVVQLRLVK